MQTNLNNTECVYLTQYNCCIKTLLYVFTQDNWCTSIIFLLACIDTFIKPYLFLNPFLPSVKNTPPLSKARHVTPSLFTYKWKRNKNPAVSQTTTVQAAASISIAIQWFIQTMMTAWPLSLGAVLLQMMNVLYEDIIKTSTSVPLNEISGDRYWSFFGLFCCCCCTSSGNTRLCPSKHTAV